MVKVIRHVAVGNNGRIDGLRPIHQRDLRTNSTADVGQQLIRYLTTLVNRLLNADVSDHARNLLFSVNPPTHRKDGGIRLIDISNDFATKVGSKAVTPSLARQLSPTQICVDIQGTCEAAVNAIRRYVIHHIQSGQSQKNSIIVKLYLKRAFSTVRRDNLLRVCSQHAPTTARLDNIANKSPSTVFAYGHQICLATGIQQDYTFVPVLLTIAFKSTHANLTMSH